MYVVTIYLFIAMCFTLFCIVFCTPSLVVFSLSFCHLFRQVWASAVPNSSFFIILFLTAVGIQLIGALVHGGGGGGGGGGGEGGTDWLMRWELVDKAEVESQEAESFLLPQHEIVERV